MRKGEAERTPLSVTASESSEKAQRSKDSVKADSTTYPSLSTKPSEHMKTDQNVDPGCNCPNKRDAFFEKLLNYLEKQSEVISRCCYEKGTSVRHKRLNTDPIFDKAVSPCSNSASISDKSKPRSEDRLKSQKSKDNECKIIVEVCTCDGNKGVKPAASNKSLKSYSKKEPEDERKIANAIDCSKCERKVENFFKLAEEICQAYMKRCLMNDDLKDLSPQHSEQVARIEELNYMTEPRRTAIQEREGDGRGCNSLAVEIECHGDREEFLIQPCDCARKSGRTASHYPSGTSQYETGGNQSPKKNCIELFEERYGQILRDLHSKLMKPNTQVGQGYGNPPQGNPPPPPGVQQQYPPSQQPTYPPPQRRQPDSRSQNSNSLTQPGQYPPSQDPYQPPHQDTYSQNQPYPPVQPYGEPRDDSPSESDRKRSKSSDKGKKKKKGRRS